MKRCVILAVAVALLSLLLTPALATSKNALSEMSEQQCLEFIKQYNIQIPSDYTEEMWAPFVKEVIKTVELNPEYEFAFNYSVTLAFANAIKDAVNDYYGVIANQNAIQPVSEYMTSTSTYVLQDSSAFGEWMLMHADYNCYVYSIDTPEFIWKNPGYWSGQAFDLSLGILDIADLAMDDLAALGHERIYRKSTLEATNLCTNEKIICVRRGTYDYHFMKFDDGGWYHKPGNSAILKYKYSPSVMRTWSNEALMASGATAPTLYYDSSIVFISYDGHDWKYTYYNNDIHRKTCNICGDSFTYSCDYDYSYAGDGTHTVRCVDCGHTVSSECSSFITTSNNDGTHVTSCTDCGNGTTEICRPEYTNLTNTTHSAACTKCDYYIASQACQLNYRAKDGETHTVSCTKCENRRTENCTLVYESHGDNTHSHLCALCGYVKSDHVACLFNDNNICRICYGPKNGAVINKQEELTPD